MAVIFKVDNHVYESVNTTDSTEWTSVTQFVDMFKEHFDAVAVSQKCTKNRKSKWFGIPPAKIRRIWEEEGKRAAEAGTFYHDQREQDITSLDTIERQGVTIPIIKPIYDDGVKYAPEQNMGEGIYPEHFVYLKSAGICGQADRVEVVKDTIDIIDFKTNKEIKKRGFTNWEGIVKRMKAPISHLDDCNFIHYSLQLSLYMYIMLRHNPTLKPGKLTLHHIVFDKEGENEYGYPLYKKDHDGQFIVKEVIPYECAYLKNEVKAMINWLKNKNK